MTFNLIDSYYIKCNEKDDEYGLWENWEATILISDTGKVIGFTNDDNKQLIVGDYSDVDNVKMIIYRFFNDDNSVYLYEFPSEYSKKNDVFGTFSVFTDHGIDGLGNCFFNLEKYSGDYKQIIEFYVNTINNIKENKDMLKLSIINEIFNSNINNQEHNKNIIKK